MVRCIGQGSYGEVWLARNAVNTWRAVKVVYSQNFKDPKPYEREFAGIQRYEPLSRSNEGLIDVLQIGRNDSAGYFYYVMELADPADPDPSEESASEHCEAGGSTNGSKDAARGFDPDSYVPKTLSRVIQQRGRLSYEECLTLGLTLNLALGHLHRNELIHRDVKPSNIVFVNGVPKLTDIGLVTDLAGAESFVGTEGFIPPEGPNSPQADLYALGKVLYEASMGKDRNEFPEPMTGLGLNNESKAVMELNAVLVRACAPDPKERYRRAEEMNADLALLHSGESVRSKHLLQLRLKRMKRAAMVTMAVIVLAVVPYYLALREARIAKTQSHRSEAVARCLEDMLKGVKPSYALGRDTTMLRDLLDHATNQFESDLKGEPEVQAEMCMTLGGVYQELGAYEVAAQMFAKALEIYQPRLNRDDPLLAQCLSDLALALSSEGQGTKAQALQERALAIRLKRFGPESAPVAEALHNLGVILAGEARLSEAKARFEQALEIRNRVCGPESKEVAESMDGIAHLLNSVGSWSEAESMFRATRELYDKLTGHPSPSSVGALNGLVQALSSQKKFKEAEATARLSLTAQKKLFGADHPWIATSLTILARVLASEHRPGEAKAKLQEALTIWNKRTGNQDPSMGETVSALFDILLEEERFDQADEIYKNVLAQAESNDSPNKSVLAACGHYLARLGRWERAIEVFTKLKQLEPLNHHNYQALAALYIQVNDIPAYRNLCEEIYKTFAPVTNDSRIADRMAKSCLILPPNGHVLRRAADWADLAVNFDETSANNPWFHFCKGFAEYRLGNYESATGWMERVFEHLPDGSHRDVEAYMVLAMALHRSNYPQDALVAFEEGRQLAERRLRPLEKRDIQSGWTDWVLAKALMREAEQVLTQPPGPAAQVSESHSSNPR
ncbi:MAG TPA: serine/threonine-protein kinase [Verrucomicrobiae bacterium]|nr:serine/threonine-protein kinase [Verrucomicrobiae bacterium]